MGFLAETKCRVIIAGQDVTSRFDPHLLSLKISRSGKSASDEADIDLADPDGAIVLPQKRSPVEVTVGGVSAFSGFVADVDYDFSDGRKLTLSASSIDQGSKVKEPAMRHKDDAGFADVAKEWGSKVGLEVSVAGSITDVHRDYWLSHNESFMSWGNRIAAEIGASFKIQGSRAYFVGINEGLSGSGKVLRPISATWGVNLLGGSISPIISRPKFKNVKISYFDIAKGEHTEVDVPTGIEDVDAALRTAITSADEKQSKQKGSAIGKNSDREKGSGSVSILGEIYAEPEAILTLSGIRPGIDGSYRVSSVDHEIGSSGFRTNCTLKQPHDGAGVDSR